VLLLVARSFAVGCAHNKTHQKPEDGTWQSFDVSANTTIETQYKMRAAGLSPPGRFLANNGVAYVIDFDQMIQYRYATLRAIGTLTLRSSLSSLRLTCSCPFMS
jgi:hypothetical protein